MRDPQYPGRSPVMSTRAMVATSQPMATQAGLEMLRRGGNAMDAAIAASATLCVTEPQSTGVGGDCFILYHESESGRLHGLNGSGRMPRRGTLEALRRRGTTQRMPEQGILTVTVPVERPVPRATRQELEARGHQLVEAEKPFGGAQCIHIDWQTGVLQAASDPRKDGCALGY